MIVRLRKEPGEILLKEHKKTDVPITVLAGKAILEKYGPKKTKTKHPDFDEMKEIYSDYWMEYNRVAYQWNGVIDNTALNRLIKSLENLNTSDNSLSDLFRIIMGKLPEFYKDKSINAINKNLNGIIATIKNGGDKGRKIQSSGIYDFTK